MGQAGFNLAFYPFLCEFWQPVAQEGQGQATPFCVAGDVLGNLWGKAYPQKQTKQEQIELNRTTIEVFLSWCAHTHTWHSVWTVGISQ